MQYENKKKGLKKQLFAAIIMLLVAALALGTSTYAWFVNNTEVTAEGMEVNATADAALLIKGLTNSKDEAYSSVGTNVVSVKTMKPSTSYDGLNFGYLSSGIKVNSETSAAASWGDGGFKSTSLTKATAEGTYYVESQYSIKSSGEDGNVGAYVKSITTKHNTDNTIDKALRVSISDGTSTYVFNPNSGTNLPEGVGKYKSEDSTWSLASKTYDSVGTTSKFIISNSAASTITVRIWYEGQDTLCTTAAINATAQTLSIKFDKTTAK